MTEATFACMLRKNYTTEHAVALHHDRDHRGGAYPARRDMGAVDASFDLRAADSARAHH